MTKNCKNKECNIELSTTEFPLLPDFRRSPYCLPCSQKQKKINNIKQHKRDTEEILLTYNNKNKTVKSISQSIFAEFGL